MKLKKYIDQEKLSLGNAAKDCGLEYEAFRLYTVDKRIPRPGAMAKIAKWTKGAVTVADFYEGAA